MNETIQKGYEMSAAHTGVEDIMRVIVDNTRRTRPEKDVYFAPYRPVEGIAFEQTLASVHIDMAALFPQAGEGDTACVDFNIRVWADAEIYLNVRGDVKVWYNDVHVFTCVDNVPDREMGFARDLYNIPIAVRAGADNRVRIKCVHCGDRFGFRVNVSHRRYPGMWANDYLFAARAVCPADGFGAEDGFAVTAPVHTGKRGAAALDDNTDAGAYVLPQPVTSAAFDFRALCGHGDTCYVYTEAAEAHTLTWKGAVAQAFVNGQERPFGKEGLAVQKGDKILLKCTRTDNGWGLELDDGKLCLPFLQSQRGCGDKAVFAGPFYGTGVCAPEYDWDFSRVFTNSEGERLYWRFCDGSQLRMYLDSVFFGQWFYALMVGFHGIRRAAQALGDADAQRLFVRNMRFLAKYRDYIHYDISQNVMPGFMPRSDEYGVLDSIGTMGMNLVDAYLDCNAPELRPVIDQLARQTDVAVPRLDDGTYYRVETMWADDLYMSCPFLVRLGRMTGDKSWYQKAIDQLMGFRRKLYMQDERLFSHIYFPREGVANRAPWGRGNGWVMWTMAEILLHAEEGVNVEPVLSLFREMAGGIRDRQDESGLWRQVLNRDEEGSYLETSCTGMFLLAFARGVRCGWLDDSYIPVVRRAWDGLMCRSVDRDGNVYGVCMGSGCSMEAEYYYTIPTTMNDDHGTGVILAAACELRMLMEARPDVFKTSV